MAQPLHVHSNLAPASAWSLEPESAVSRDVDQHQGISMENIPLASKNPPLASHPPPHPSENPKVDASLVVWDGPLDPDNPQNFPRWKKWMITWLFGCMNMWVTFSSTIFASAAAPVATEYHVSREVTTLGVSLVVLVCFSGPGRQDLIFWDITDNEKLGVCSWSPDLGPNV
jgi:hypothetical protein